MALTQVTVPYIRGYDYGIGADLATGSPMGKVIDSPHSPVEGAPGATVSFQVRRIQSTEELEESLGIDAEASYGCAAFGAGVSARFSFAQQQKVQSSSLFISVTTQVELGFVSIDDPALTSDAASLMDRPDVFAARYGNMFVRGIGRGGLFVGIMRVETSSSEESQQISAELQGSYGLFSAEAKTKFDEIQRKYRTSVFVDMYHEGGPTGLAIRNPTNPVELLDNANAFLQSFETNAEVVAKPYFVTLAPITIARGPMPPNEADIQHAQDVLVACTKARSRLLDKLNLLEYIIDNESKFNFTAGADRQSINTSMGLFQADLDLVAECASMAIRSPSKADMPATFAAGRGQTYPAGKLPDPLPIPKEGKTVLVPDFSGCESWIACNEMATRVGLIAQQQFANVEPAERFSVLSVLPPKDTPVPEGSTVTITTHPIKVDPRLFIRVDQFRRFNPSVTLSVGRTP